MVLLKMIAICLPRAFIPILEAINVLARKDILEMERTA